MKVRTLNLGKLMVHTLIMGKIKVCTLILALKVFKNLLIVTYAVVVLNRWIKG